NLWIFCEPFTLDLLAPFGPGEAWMLASAPSRPPALLGPAAHAPSWRVARKTRRPATSAWKASGVADALRPSDEHRRHPLVAGAAASIVIWTATAARKRRCRLQQRRGGAAVVGGTTLIEADSRLERDKGAQQLPLGRQLQRIFSYENQQFWNWTVFPRTYFFRRWVGQDCRQAAFLTIVHLGALAAP
ncbi:unnamed protein product, partial [Polarella glacialis]